MILLTCLNFEGFLSDRYMKYKPGFKPNPSKPMPVGTTWDWAKERILNGILNGNHLKKNMVIKMNSQKKTIIVVI